MLPSKLQRQAFRVIPLTDKYVLILPVTNLNGNGHQLRGIWVDRSALFVHSEPLGELGGLIGLLAVMVSSVVEREIFRHVAHSVHHGEGRVSENIAFVLLAFVVSRRSPS